MFKKFIFSLFVMIFILYLGMKEGLSQSVFQDEKEPQIRLRNVTFQIREIESTPSPLKIFEVHIEILNQSGQLVAPPNSIKVVVVPKEMKYSGPDALVEFGLFQEEVTIDVPLPPRTWRVVTIGFSIPEGELESITFEVQINPPEGEKKTVSFNL